MQYILVFETSLLKERHLDSIIISSIYVIMKLHKQQITWHQLNESYQALDTYDVNEYDEVFRAIYTGYDSQKVDIQNFYNNIYCKVLSKYLKSLQRKNSVCKSDSDEQSTNMLGRTPVIKGLMCSTPLKENLPLNIRSTSWQTVNWIRRRNTPAQTKTLFKFGDSPASNFKSYNSYLRKRSNEKSDLLTEL